jgi:biotin carboxyl carrier protein
MLATLPSGWRNNPSGPQRASYEIDGRAVEVAYRFDHGSLSVTIDEEEIVAVTVHDATPTRVDLEVDGVRRLVHVTRVGNTVYVDNALGHSVLVERPRFPDPAGVAQVGSLLAPMPGTVVRVEVALGDIVEAGTTVVAIEAMKMEHAVLAPGHGVITEIPVAVGDQVDGGSVLAVLEEETHE